MKTIGLVGGMTPESTVIYYRTIIGLGRGCWPDPVHNPVVLIYSIDLAELVARQTVGDEQLVVDHLAGVLERLRGAGAELGALTANTPHAYFGGIAAATGLPLVSIVDAAAMRTAELGAGRVLLLGTRVTMASSMYPDALRERGIEVVVPGEADRDLIHHSIFAELAAGKVSPELKASYLEICRRAIEDEGVDAVLMACTEIPLVLERGDLPVPLVDTARCHAEAIFTAALEPADMAG